MESVVGIIKTGRSDPVLSAVRPGPGRGNRLSGAVCSTAFGCPRNFLNNRFVYTVISPRARGLSVGVNMNPDRQCNFDCLYCEVNRHVTPRETRLDTGVMADELQHLLELVHSGRLRDVADYRSVPEELLRLRQVALSGDGEPTLSPDFVSGVHAVMHVRALGRVPYFKVVLLTNATGLDRPAVKEGLRFFTRQDEVWAKLDGGTSDYMARINRPDVPLERVLANILFLARRRPVIIQSLFPAIHGEGPSDEEIDQYALRLKELKSAGAQIPLVQIYSATRPTPHSECGHLPLKTLFRIARNVRAATGLEVEVF